MKNKKTAVIYVHGFNSSSAGETAIGMQKVLEDGGYKFVPFDYSTEDLANPSLITSLIIGEVIDHELDGYEVILMGCSLGGYFALWAADDFTKCLLVNPSLFPFTSLKKYDLPEDTLDALAGHWMNPVGGEPMIVVCGNQDDTVNPNANGRALRDIAKVVNVDMGHRLDPSLYGYVKTLIDELDNTVTEYN